VYDPHEITNKEDHHFDNAFLDVCEITCKDDYP
jgi:hypothetical protein